MKIRTREEAVAEVMDSLKPIEDGQFNISRSMLITSLELAYSKGCTDEIWRGMDRQFSPKAEAQESKEVTV